MPWGIKLVRAVARLLSFMLLAGCATSGGGGGGWPVETYPNACRASMIPFEPGCLIQLDNGFKYSGEFQACRASMSNYYVALDTFYDCSDRDLKAIFDELLESVPATYDCYVGYFQANKEGDPSAACPPIDVPRFLQAYQADGLAISLGVPRCIRKSEGYNFAPKRAWELDDCRRQVDTFMGKATLLSDFDAAPAQSQYDTYLQNLRRVLNRKADQATNKFNCLAERRPFCV